MYCEAGGSAYDACADAARATRFRSPPPVSLNRFLHDGCVFCLKVAIMRDSCGATQSAEQRVVHGSRQSHRDDNRLDGLRFDSLQDCPRHARRATGQGCKHCGPLR